MTPRFSFNIDLTSSVNAPLISIEQIYQIEIFSKDPIIKIGEKKVVEYLGSLFGKLDEQNR